MLNIRWWLGLVAVIVSAGSWAQQCDSEQRENTPNERFVIHEGQTVTDRVTGLEWQRCTLGQGWDGQRCSNASKQTKAWFSWHSAQNEAQKMGNDWRVPTVHELRSLMSRRCKDPAINVEIFPNAPSWSYWSVTPFSQNDDYGWQIDFKTGKITAQLKTGETSHVRLVRGRVLPPSRKSNKPVSETERLQKLWDDGVHDPNNPDLELLQHSQQVFDNLPKDSRGDVDWAKALNSGAISPRTGRTEELEMVFWDQDILFTETAGMAHVRFPHSTHSQWLACENCHDQIFAAQRGGSGDISMGAIYSGQYCGVCHGKVAFSPNNCERCHSVMHEGAGAKWW